MSSQKSDKTTIVDEIVKLELLSGLHKESGGRIDLVADVMQSQMDQLRKVQQKMFADMSNMGHSINPLDQTHLDSYITAEVKDIDGLRFIHKNGLINNLVEYSDKKEKDKGWSKEQNQPRADATSKRRGLIIKFMADNYEKYKWKEGDNPFSQKKSSIIKRDFASKENYPEYNNPRILTDDFCFLGIQKKKPSTKKNQS